MKLINKLVDKIDECISAFKAKQREEVNPTNTATIPCLSGTMIASAIDKPRTYTRTYTSMWPFSNSNASDPQNWVIEKSRSFIQQHFKVNDIGEKRNTRDVKVAYVVEKNIVTKERRARVLYGDGSLFKDDVIDVNKALLIIEGKL